MFTLFDAASDGMRGVRRRGTSRPAIVAFGGVAGLVLVLAGCGGSGSAGPAGTGAGHGVHEAAGPANGRLVNRAAAHTGAGSSSSVASGVLFGGNTALAGEEPALGRRLAIVRVYYQMGEPFPAPQSRQLMAAGSTLLVSLDTVAAMGGPSYASIVAGREDAYLSRFLREMDHAAVRYHLGAIYIDFEHEADERNHLPLGSYAEFDQAWDHIHALAVAQHLDWNQGGRLHWVLILLHNAYKAGSSHVSGLSWAAMWWPGAGEVDAVATDGYNSYACRLRRAGGVRLAPKNNPSPAQLFDPVISFAAAHGGLPVFIAEWGAAASPPATQARFIQEMQAFVTANHEIAGVMYWDSRGSNCSYVVDGNPPAVAALATMGRSGALQGKVMGGR